MKNQVKTHIIERTTSDKSFCGIDRELTPPQSTRRTRTYFSLVRIAERWRQMREID